MLIFIIHVFVYLPLSMWTGFKQFYQIPCIPRTILGKVPYAKGPPP